MKLTGVPIPIQLPYTNSVVQLIGLVGSSPTVPSHLPYAQYGSGYCKAQRFETLNFLYFNRK